MQLKSNHYGGHRKLLVATSTGTILLDQISKYWAQSRFEPGEVLPIIPGLFNLTLHFNPGAAFGMMAGLPDGTRQIALAATTLVALSCIIYFLARNLFDSISGRVALGLIIGGAFGNIIDRVRLGEVVDFLDFYWGQYHWPAFNVADSAICIGVGILLLLPPRHPVGPTEPS